MATVTGSASATVTGGAKTVGVGKADSNAIGIQGGGATNVISNAGGIDVTATGNATVTNNSKSGELFSDATTRSDVASVATARAISAGAGDNVVTNDDTLRTTALAIGQGFAYASGSHISVRVGIGDGKADAKATVESNGFGISLGDGANRVVNNALLSVSSQATTVKTLVGSTTVCTQESVGAELVCHEEASPVNLDANPTYASANGNGVNGVGIATSSGKATSNAVGVDVGHGGNVIVNDRNGTIDITADPVAKALAIADADLNGDAKGTATATAVAFAAGIRGGDGANDITNLGQLTVRAVPTAQAKAQVSAGFCIDLIFTTWCGGGTGRGTATARFTATAVGIQTGDGANRVVNDGALTVTAEPTVDDFAARVIAEDDEKKTLSTPVTSSAIGIQTGNGNNDVLNDTHGVVDVKATGIGCSSCQTVTAFGIQTGTGHDVIVNNGAISATALGQVTTAIDAGDGNDRVVLGTGSHTSGDVLLGAGNNRLVWSAAASLTDGIADGGAAGVDVFALGGSTNGNFQLSQIGNPFQGFERFHKEGSSTWTLLGNKQVDWTVENGHLAVSGLITGTIDTTAPDAPGLLPVIDVLSTGIVRRNDGVMAAVRVDTGGVLDNDGLLTPRRRRASASRRSGRAALWSTPATFIPLAWR